MHEMMHESFSRAAHADLGQPQVSVCVRSARYSRFRITPARYINARARKHTHIRAAFVFRSRGINRICLALCAGDSGRVGGGRGARYVTAE